VLRLALPATAAGILTQLYRPIDQYFVAHLGEEAQGAIGSTTFVLILFASAFLLISAGAGPLVARATGAGDPDERRRILGASLFGCGVLSIFVVACGLWFVDPIVGLLGVSGATAEQARAYLGTIFVTGAALVFAPLVTASFNAMGDTRLPLMLQIGNVLLNVALNPLLIDTAGLGVRGSAIASTVSQSLAMAVGVVILWRRAGMRIADVRPGPELVRVVKVGFPIAMATAAYGLVYMAMLGTSISRLGPAVNAGLGVGFGGLEAISYPLYLGGSTALASLIGRCLGAGRVDLAWDAVRLLGPPVVGLGVMGGLVFWFGGPALVGIFADDPDVFREGVRYASILAFSQPAVAFEAYCEGVLAGAGDSRRLFWATVPFNVLRIPLAYLFAIHLGYGPAGIWWAINLTSYGKAIAKGTMVASGGWARIGRI
jgi:MATE family multidrug resistance protein